jgi:hypothetical protein
MEMAKTAAQRQAAYRARRAHAGREGNGERRLSLWISTEVAVRLARLARHHQVTRREIIERLVTAEDERVLKGIESDTPQWEAYFGLSVVT